MAEAIFFTFFSFPFFYFFLLSSSANGGGSCSKLSAGADVKLSILDDRVLVDNGIVELVLTKPGGGLIGLRYGGIDNLLEVHNPRDLNGGFWDLDWSELSNTDISGKFDRNFSRSFVSLFSIGYISNAQRSMIPCRLNATRFEVITESKDQVELSFQRIWNIQQQGQIVPLNVDKRFVLLRGCSGFYSYGIYEHTKEMPGFVLFTTRIAFLLNSNKFHYMAVADNIQRFMPSRIDRLPGRGQELDYKEAVLLTNPLEKDFKGEVDDKYFYTLDDKDNRVHGWISQDPGVGFWQITPSNEFRTGGPFKHDLTSHVGPATLAIFVTPHYAGTDLAVKIEKGEEWKKVFGPVFIYLNSAKTAAESFSLWDDAKKQMNTEIESWPYTFPASIDFPKSNKRGKVSGRLLVKDNFVSKANIVAKGAYVGLSAPGFAGSWQREWKGYQFWTRVNDDGSFVINNVREGNYNLYASVPGFIGDYKREIGVNVIAGGNLEVGDIVYEPPRNGPTLWEIGFPDRSAAEFYIPDPSPLYKTKTTLNNSDRFRQYGLWERYTELYPNNDLVYTIGVSDHRKDWFFAHVTRKTSAKTYNGTTWQIKFQLENVIQTGNYTLRLALASAHASNLDVRINEGLVLFSTGMIGGDNAIARHGIHGIYWLFSVNIPPRMLIKGGNIVYLTQTKGGGPFKGLMYDYIRLEGPRP